MKSNPRGILLREASREEGRGNFFNALSALKNLKNLPSEYLQDIYTKAREMAYTTTRRILLKQVHKEETSGNLLSALSTLAHLKELPAREKKVGDDILFRAIENRIFHKINIIYANHNKFQRHKHAGSGHDCAVGKDARS